MGKINWEKCKRVIINMYIREELSVRAIAEQYDVSHVMIALKLDEWGVKRRGGIQNAVDISGQRFGKLLVLNRVRGSYPSRWLVLCDCGVVDEYTKQQLNKNRSCGCAPRGPRPGKIRPDYSKTDLTGLVVGNLTVVGRVKDSMPVKWRVKCTCGNMREYTYSHLLQIKSCGCLPRGRKPKK